MKRAGDMGTYQEDLEKRRKTEEPGKPGTAPPSRAGSRPPAKPKTAGSITYREGEPLNLSRFQLNREEPGDLFVVKIPSEHMTGNNPQVKARQLWGCDEYTEDSDIVAVLMHMGYYNYSNVAPPQNVEEIRAYVRPLPPRDSYPCVVRNHLRSRAWSCGDAAIKPLSYTVERCELLTRSNAEIELRPNREVRDSQMGALPTVVPATSDRGVGTRATTAAMERRQRVVQEVSIQYSLCNEPWYKYSVPALADRGLKPSQWTSSRLRTEVLYLETPTERYELALADPADAAAAGGADGELVYRFSRCKVLLPLTGMRRAGIPLPRDAVEVIEPSLAWEELCWAPLELVVKGSRRIGVVRFRFLARQQGSA